jgi:hypothetical protein
MNEERIGKCLRQVEHICGRSLVLFLSFVDRCLSFCTFSFWPLCCLIVFDFDIRILITLLVSSNSSSSIYGLWLPLWHLQTLLMYNFVCRDVVCYAMICNIYITFSYTFYVYFNVRQVLFYAWAIYHRCYYFICSSYIPCTVNMTGNKNTAIQSYI